MSKCGGYFHVRCKDGNGKIVISRSISVKYDKRLLESHGLGRVYSLNNNEFIKWLYDE